ncbi:MAG: hypothetical protein ABFR89_04265 [Actinomycetota bacterium]
MRGLRTLSILALTAVLGGCQTDATGESVTPAAADITTTLATTTTTVTETTTTTASAPITTTTTTTTTLPVVECTVTEIGSDEDFHRQTCEQSGITIVASGNVAERALVAAAGRMAGMLAEQPDVAAAVAASIDHVAVIGRDEQITDLPGFEDLYRLHPGTDWKRLGRSFPGSDEIPVSAGAEENLLCLEGDRYEGEDMFVHDFARTIRRFGIAEVDPALDRAIEDAYGRAIAADLWRNTLAEVNSDEYWAEGSQSFFDVNAEADDEKDQAHNNVNTRDELRSYDPGLYGLLVEAFGETNWRPGCG